MNLKLIHFFSIIDLCIKCSHLCLKFVELKILFILASCSSVRLNAPRVRQARIVSKGKCTIVNQEHTATDRVWCLIIILVRNDDVENYTY